MRKVALQLRREFRQIVHGWNITIAGSLRKAPTPTLLQHCVHHRRVGLARHRFHRLADEEQGGPSQRVLPGISGWTRTMEVKGCQKEE